MYGAIQKLRNAQIQHFYQEELIEVLPAGLIFLYIFPKLQQLVLGANPLSTYAQRGGHGGPPHVYRGFKTFATKTCGKLAQSLNRSNNLVGFA